MATARAWKLVGVTLWNKRTLNLPSHWEHVLCFGSPFIPSLSAFNVPSVLPYSQSPLLMIRPPVRRYGHGFEMFCLASDSTRTVVASACKVSAMSSGARQYVTVSTAIAVESLITVIMQMNYQAFNDFFDLFFLFL